MARKASKQLKQELDSMKEFQEKQIDALNQISQALEKTVTATSRVNDAVSSLDNAMTSMVNDRRRREQEAEEERGKKDLKKSADDASAALKKLGSRLVDLAKVVADTANKYSKISNDLISVSGATGASVRDTRSVIVQDIISQINKETGTFFNPEESYKKVVDIAQQANIGNLEAIEEITRPILLASESMNVNNTELASIMNKWYTRYNFSSAAMEEMVDEIRGNTAGNNATAEATLQNISKFQNFIGVYADSTAEMQNMVKAISEESARLESVGINSGYIFDYMKQIGQGDLSDSTTIMSLLSNSGTGMTWTEAQKLLRSGNADDMKLVSQALESGAENLGNKLKDSTVSAEAMKAYGVDIEEIYNILSASGALLSADQFERSVSGAQSALESIDDKFNTHKDKLSNWFSGISEHFANLQERWGIGLSDIIWALTAIYTAIQTGKVLQGLGGATSGAGGTAGMASTVGGIGSKLLNSNIGATQWVNATMAGESMGLTGTAATAAGAAATVGGIAAGAALTVDGVKGMIDDGSDYAEKALSGVEAAGGAAGIAGIAALGATNPVGWVALAIGGIAFLGKKAYEEAHELAGNAETVSKEILDVAEGVKNKNKEKGTGYAKNAGYDYIHASGLEDKKQILRNTGLYRDEDIDDAETEEELDALEGAVNSAYSKFDVQTEGLSQITKEYAQKYQSDQQYAFIEELRGLEGSDRVLALKYLLENGSYDDKTKKKIEKALKDNKVTNSEWKNILDGGKNAWFDDYTLEDSQISLDLMRQTAGMFGFTGTYDDSSKYYTAFELYDALVHSLNIDEWNDAMKAIEDSGLGDLISSMYGKTDEGVEYEGGFFNEIKRQMKAQGLPGFRVGSNFIEKDQVATIHEGEAVVPKKYNPAANVTELEMLRQYYKENANRSASENNAALQEMASVLSEIKEFLSYWQEDSNKRNDQLQRSLKFSGTGSYIARYMPS